MGRPYALRGGGIEAGGAWGAGGEYDAAGGAGARGDGRLQKLPYPPKSVLPKPVGRGRGIDCGTGGEDEFGGEEPPAPPDAGAAEAPPLPHSWCILCSRVPCHPHFAHFTWICSAMLTRVLLGVLLDSTSFRHTGHSFMAPRHSLQKMCPHGTTSTGSFHESRHTAQVSSSLKSRPMQRFAIFTPVRNLSVCVCVCCVCLSECECEGEGEGEGVYYTRETEEMSERKEKLCVGERGKPHSPH